MQIFYKIYLLWGANSEGLESQIKILGSARSFTPSNEFYWITIYKSSAVSIWLRLQNIIALYWPQYVRMQGKGWAFNVLWPLAARRTCPSSMILSRNIAHTDSFWTSRAKWEPDAVTMASFWLNLQALASTSTMANTTHEISIVGIGFCHRFRLLINRKRDHKLSGRSGNRIGQTNNRIRWSKWIQELRSLILSVITFV